MDQRVLAPPHSLSQRATSFIASQCQGIHQMPLLRLIVRHAFAWRFLSSKFRHTQGQNPVVRYPSVQPGYGTAKQQTFACYP